MAKSSEEISKYTANSGGKTDSNLANDTLHVGGIPAGDFATKKYVQEYHKEKEDLQKQYIDKQDAENLQEAKSYAEQIVGNQDFTGFATKTDVQAVNENLTNKINNEINNCKATCANNLQSVVNDVNANFDDVGKSIETLNNTTNNLFQSVSNGKEKVAGAITDKGVSTSANDSFDTMATNIRNIKTSSGEIDENFVNTSDATATEEDILIGKTAYSKGSKIYGSHVCQSGGLDTSDATATPYDILSGKTAYSKGSKITGVLNIDDAGIPSYGVGATEPIYGTVTDEYTLYSLSGGPTIDTLYPHRTILYDTEYNNPEFMFATKSTTSDSLNCNELHVWRIVKQNQKYVLGNEQVFNLSDLGLTDNTEGTISSSSYKIIAIGASSLRIGNPYLAIAVYKDSKNCELNILPIETEKEKIGENQIITKVKFSNESLKHHTIISDSYINFSSSIHDKGSEIQISDDGCYFAFVNGNGVNNKNRACVLMIIGYIYSSTFDISTDMIDIQGKGERLNFDTIHFVNNNLLAVQLPVNSVFKLELILFEYNEKKLTILSNTTINYCLGISRNDLYCITRLSESSMTFKLSKVNVNYEQFVIDVVDVKTFTIMNESDEYLINETNLNYKKGFIISSCDLLLYYSILSSSLTLEFYKINIDADEVLTFIGKESLSKSMGSCTLIRGNSFFYFDSAYAIELGKNFSDVIGLKYNGEYYYKQKQGLLSANSDDVRSGKTFIGKSGYQETGTLEV